MASKLDPDLSKKQHMFLKILEQGHSALDFVDFLNTKKPGLGQDLGNFTVDEIQQYIDEFIKNSSEQTDIKIEPIEDDVTVKKPEQL